MSELLTAALTYADAGIPVLPLHTPTPAGRCSCARASCNRPGKHPRWHRGLITRGLHQASTDPAQLRAWWAHWPTANIGLRTGIVHDVCDIDSVTGLEALLELLGDHAITGPTVFTGSGGWHIYLAATGLGNRVGILPGVDWRGVGGYVVAPPSMHASGQPYRWSRHLVDATLQPCPMPLRSLILDTVPPLPNEHRPAPHKPARYAEVALAGEAAKVRAASPPRIVDGVDQPGNRNDTLNRSAFALGQLVAAGLLDRRTVERELTAAALAVGLGRVETARTISSGLNAGSRRPRHSAA
jgi:Bifunctional DNA primase/polymerase, N-terminal